MNVSAIVAVAKNNVMGNAGDIPWHLSADLKYFKKVTLNHHIIMGRKTYESIGRPLPKRTNIVMTRQPFYLVSNCLMAQDIEDALSLAYDNGEKEAFIIGGGEIYKSSMPYWDKLYLTEVDLEVKGDTYFPEMDMDEWIMVSEEKHLPDEKNEYAYTFKVFERKQKLEESE